MKTWPLIFLSVSIACSSGAAEPAPEITKEIALKAVVLFREDPFSRGPAAILVRFAEKSPDVLLT